MKIKCNVSFTMKPVEQIIREKGLAPGGDVQQKLTNTVMSRMVKYMPYRTGALIKEMGISSVISKNYGLIVVPGKRSVPLYHGVQKGRPINYTKTMNPLAGPHWDRRMMAAEGAQIQKELQTYIDRKTVKK